MTLNMHAADRWLRALIAAVIGILYYRSVIGGITGGILVAIAIILLATAVVGHCPLYRLLGIHTARQKQRQ